MTNILRSGLRVSVLGVSILAFGGCNLDVTNPSVIDAAQFDPASDGAALSLSAQEQFYLSFASLVTQGAYLSEELWNASTNFSEKQFAQRQPDYTSAGLAAVFRALSTSLASNGTTIATLSQGAQAGSDVNLARAQMNAGFSFTLMAESFCNGVVAAGPLLTTSMLLDSAVARFGQAITTGTAAAAAGVAEGTKIVNASTIGLARAYLQAGNNAQAATHATRAIANDPNGTFTYNAIYLSTNGTTYYNPIYNGTPTRVHVVSPAYRALNDGRVSWSATTNKTQDGLLTFFMQLKYPLPTTPIRIASTLEASYVLAEAQLKQGNAAPATTLIAARRAVSPGATYLTTASLLTQLEDVRLRDFWLEGKKLGDWRRNPSDTPYIDPAGSPFYEGTGTFSTLRCFLIPFTEIQTNPNLPKTGDV